MSQIDYKKLMRRALKLALKGRGCVSPNPRVGAVIVGSDGQVLGEGYHRRCGLAHAEIEALNSCQPSRLKGSTLVVTLEPCCHQGRTPPCVAAIIKAGIRKVVAATSDPNPKVKGQGFMALRAAGIEVETGVLEGEAKYLNRGYFSHLIRGRAWCAAKIALSIDGKMANREGMSKWITCAEARKLAHAMRADHDSILVGSGTVYHDNPELTVRMLRGENPTRIILAPRSGITHGSTLARTAKTVPTILITDETSNPPGTDLEGIITLRLPASEQGRIDPELILRELPERGLLSVLIEGGSQVLSSFLEAEMIDEISVGMAPSIIGEGISPFEYFKPKSWEWRPRFVVQQIKRLGSDVIVIYRREGDPFSRD